MDVLVTGARGSQQSPIVDALLERKHRVTALSRGQDQDPRPARWIQGDLSDVPAFASQIEQLDGLAFHRPVSAAPWPMDPLLTATSAWGVKHVVFNASAAVPPPGTKDHPGRATVDALSKASLTTTVFEPTLYLENLLLPFVLAGVQDGVLRYPLPASGLSVAWMASIDLGSLAAAALERGAEGSFAVGGPNSLNGDQLAASISRGLRREIKFEFITPDAFGRQLKALIGEQAAGGVQQLYTAIGAQPATFEPWLNPDANTVWRTMDVKATTVEQWAASRLQTALESRAI